MSQLPMRCIDFVELVTEWREGALGEERRAELEEHLVICPDCTVFVDQLRLTRGALGKLDETPLSPGLRDRLLQAFSEWANE